MIVKIITRFEIRDVINNTDQIKLLKYKNFVNAIYSENITVYQFEYFFTNERTEHVDIVKKKKTVKLSMKYQNYVCYGPSAVWITVASKAYQFS